jgi:hypothetical protein
VWWAGAKRHKNEWLKLENKAMLRGGKKQEALRHLANLRIEAEVDEPI